MTITLEVPDRFLLNEEPEELARCIRLYAALFMFRSRKLSAGAAAELASVDRFSFAGECHRYDIPLVDYPAEDLGAELASLSVNA